MLRERRENAAAGARADVLYVYGRFERFRVRNGLAVVDDDDDAKLRGCVKRERV